MARSDYPKRSYEHTAEPAQGDVVRMRHNDELHHGESPSFDDSVIASIKSGVAYLVRPHLYVDTQGTPDVKIESFSVDLERLIQRFDVMTTGVSGKPENRLRLELFESGYYTLSLPYPKLGELSSCWHPTTATGLFSVLTRGSFLTKSEATRWATENLEGGPYALKWIPGDANHQREPK